MRLAAPALAALALALAAPARADVEVPSFRLSLAGPSAGAPQPQGLVEPLTLDPSLAGSGGGGQRPEPVLALVLGIIPGFGLGHLYAGARSQWTTWLIIDLVLLGGSIVLWTVSNDPLNALIWIAWVVERGFEGYFAFKAAGGSTGSAAATPVPAAGVLASLDPRGAPAVALRF